MHEIHRNEAGPTFVRMLWTNTIGRVWQGLCVCANWKTPRPLLSRCFSHLTDSLIHSSRSFTRAYVHEFQNLILAMLFVRTLFTLFLIGGRAPANAAPTVYSGTTLGNWATLPNITKDGLQYPRQEHSVALVGDNMYVLGGILPFDGTTYPTVDIVQKFNFITNTWNDIAPMPVALNHVNIAVVNGKIYYLGGLAVTATGGPAFWNASGACAVYDPSVDTWTILPDMPEGRAIGSAATLVVGDTIYLPGGLLYTNLTNSDEGTTAMFTSYNVATGEWNVLPDLPAPRDHAGKGRYKDTLYILGGRSFGHWNVVDTVFGYDTRTESWSTDFAPMTPGRGGTASATIGPTIFIAGGEGDPATSSNVFPQMQGYNVIENVWTNYTDMATPVHGSAAVAYRGKFVVPGGGLVIGGGPTQLVQAFRP